MTKIGPVDFVTVTSFRHQGVFKGFAWLTAIELSELLLALELTDKFHRVLILSPRHRGQSTIAVLGQTGMVNARD